MTSLEKLPSIAQETLGGLTAGPALLLRIRRGERSGRPVSAKRFALPAALTAAAALTAVLLTVSAPRDSQPAAAPAINTLAAGLPMEAAAPRALDIPRDSIVLKETAGAPAYRGVWEAGTGAGFPMVRLDGRYYRLLSGQPAPDRGRLTARGQVEVFTDEPALDRSSDAVSNILPAGTPLYEIPSMGGAALCAQIGQDMRVFQRVSFAGAALIGGETLASTLPAGQVSGLTLSGVGTVTQAREAQNLMAILTGSAVYQGSASAVTDQALLIHYENGLTFQMAVKGNRLMACGTWSCPDFFAAFGEVSR